MQYVCIVLGFVLVAAAVLGLIAQLWVHTLWRHRDPFWREMRHHDHLIPPAARSPRASR